MTTEIKVCMGSACFARGNEKNLEILEEYIKENNLDATVEIYGALCENMCDKGPNIKINDTIYNNVTVEEIIEILRS
jgi:NADH:ubiquinone oxidoreductase subunit E